MIGRLLQYRATQVSILLAVVPLLIGHGLGCIGDCPDPVPAQRSFVISGSSNPQSPISIGQYVNLDAGTTSFASPPGAAGGSISPVDYSVSYYGDVSHSIRASINDPGLGGSAIGQMWVHSNNQSIKLIHPAARASFLSASFPVNNAEFSSPQSSTSAGTANYVLSGGSSGAEPLFLQTQFEVYLNGVRIFLRTPTDSTSPPPISFAATAGDELRIVAGGVYASVRLDSLWLHTPGGTGIKLVHSPMSLDMNVVDVFLDLVFVLP